LSETPRTDHVQQELIRQVIREDQGGLTIYLDIGVLDTETCQPLVGAMVDVCASSIVSSLGISC